MPPKIPETASADELGRLLGLSGRQVRNLRREGVLIGAGRGRYPIAENIMRRIDQLVGQAAQRPPGVADPLTAEKIRRLRGQNARAEAGLIGAFEAHQAIEMIVGDIAQGLETLRLEGLPGGEAARLKAELAKVVGRMKARGAKATENLKAGADAFANLDT